ncbi:MAG: hypothetical protein JWN13_1151 [Betaproteobacteria bacterium]|nr:hypothetical protein [Betaproteobacteria bacterium]
MTAGELRFSRPNGRYLTQLHTSLIKADDFLGGGAKAKRHGRMFLKQVIAVWLLMNVENEALVQ